MHHPVGQCQADAAALAKARHHSTGTPEVRQALDRTHQGVAVGREGKGPVDHLLDAGVLKQREVFKSNFQRRQQAIDIGLQQLLTKRPGRVFGRPGLACALVGSEQDAVALLAQVALAPKVNHMA